MTTAAAIFRYSPYFDFFHFILSYSISTNLRIVEQHLFCFQSCPLFCAKNVRNHFIHWCFFFLYQVVDCGRQSSHTSKKLLVALEENSELRCAVQSSEQDKVFVYFLRKLVKHFVLYYLDICHFQVHFYIHFLQPL